MPLGNWEAGLEHLLGIIKLSYTALNTHIMAKRTEPGKINKSTMSLNLAASDMSLSSVNSEHGFDATQVSLECKLSVPVSMLNNYLTVSPHQQSTPEKERLLKECQDLLSGILKLPVSSESLLVKKVCLMNF